MLDVVDSLYEEKSTELRDNLKLLSHQVKTWAKKNEEPSNL